MPYESIPVIEALAGSVYCSQRDMLFPQLFRAVVETTMEHLERHKMPPEVKPLIWTQFTFDRARYYAWDAKEPAVKQGVGLVGDFTWSKTAHIHPGDCTESAIIRHHATEQEALAYLHGFDDAFDPFRKESSEQDLEPMNSEIARTADGVFTLAWRPTPADWPSPLTIYLTKVPVRTPIGEHDAPWACIIDVNGERLDPTEYGFER